MKGLVATIELLDEGGTVPFIARYRKEATGNLDEVQIRSIEEKLAYFRELQDRRATILASIEEQGKLTADDYGRDHHPRAWTIWLAGGGIKPGITIGETDDYGYNITADPVHVHDLNATILRCLGIDHRRLTYKYQGRNFRLTDTAGRVVQKALTFEA